MKFLSKNNTSEIFVNKLVYRSKKDNSFLNLKLLNEQKNFCAYTEKYIQGNDSTEVEHFNPSLKENDDYFNYYSVLRSANVRKIEKYKIYKDCPFFQTLFFRSKKQFDSRIIYDDFEYITVNKDDQDAKDFIDFLGFNDDYLYTERILHIDRLKLTISDFSDEEKRLYFRKFKGDLSYITAIENFFNLELIDILE